VFWMADPEAVFAVPVTELRYVAPVVGTLSRDRGYEPLGQWHLSEFSASIKQRLAGHPLHACGRHPA
jgi:hypothetical protein